MKKKVILVCGGPSNEHEVSLISTRNIARAVDREKFDIAVLVIAKDRAIFEIPPNLLDTQKAPQSFVTCPKEFTRLPSLTVALQAADVVFPMIHGKFGEDGGLQAHLEFLQKPYVGSGQSGSRLCMNKRITKIVAQHYGIPVVPWIDVTLGHVLPDYSDVVNKLGPIVFIKPANEGSSVGVAKATHLNQFNSAIENAFQFDDHVLIEKAVIGQEIECAILRDKATVVSIPGEIEVLSDFYSYDAKYNSPDAAVPHIPARLSPHLMTQIQDLALRTFEALECRHLARIDFFCEKGTDKIFLNEVNTLPGFTDISMYPKMIEASGVGYSQLISRLIEAASES